MVKSEQDYFDSVISQGYIEFFPELPPEVDHDCFACSPNNPIGLKMRFFGHSGTKDVISCLKLNKNYCGFPNISHGGILTLILDELMSHTLFFNFKSYGFTKTINIDFKRPVYLDRPFYVKSILLDEQPLKEKNIYELKAFVFNSYRKSQQVCAEATGLLKILPHEMMKELLNI